MISLFNADSDIHYSIIPLILTVVISFTVLGAGTTADAKFFGITLDNTCLTKIKNNISGSCPTYPEIMALFGDTSITKVSGNFSYIDGIYQRGSPKIQNSFLYYGQMNITNGIIVDPPADHKRHLHMIEIKAHLDDYLIQENRGYNSSEHSIEMGHGRFIDECRDTYVNAEEWIFLVGDSINYLNHKCNENYTHYTTTSKTFLPYVEHDISTSYKWKLEKWIKESLKNCTNRLCIPDSLLP